MKLRSGIGRSTISCALKTVATSARSVLSWGDGVGTDVDRFSARTDDHDGIDLTGSVSEEADASLGKALEARGVDLNIVSIGDEVLSGELTAGIRSVGV